MVTRLRLKGIDLSHCVQTPPLLLSIPLSCQVLSSLLLMLLASLRFWVSMEGMLFSKLRQDKLNRRAATAARFVRRRGCVEWRVVVVRSIVHLSFLTSRRWFLRMRVAVGPLGRKRREALGLSGFCFSSLLFISPDHNMT